MIQFKHILLSLGAAAMLAACEIETSGNGNLDGLWHLERVDTLATCGSTNRSENNRFWAFQAKLLNVRSAEASYLMRFAHEGDSLFLSEPYQDDRTDGDQKLDTYEPLCPYGINDVADRFRIERLKGGDMVLSNKQLRLWLKKF